MGFKGRPEFLGFGQVPLNLGTIHSTKSVGIFTTEVKPLLYPVNMHLIK